MNSKQEHKIRPILVKLTDAEHAKLEAKAAKLGMTKSGLIRRWILSGGKS